MLVSIYYHRFVFGCHSCYNYSKWIPSLDLHSDSLLLLIILYLILLNPYVFTVKT